MNKPKAPRHLLRRTSNEIGSLERYHGACGYVGIDKRDFSENIMRKDKYLVTCLKCLSLTRKGKSNVRVTSDPDRIRDRAV
jgi:hypothetical protein